MEEYKEKMNHFIADHIVIYMKLHNFHWNIAGSGFFALHAEFEKLYDMIADVMDASAERLLLLGVTPVLTLKAALEITAIEEMNNPASDANETVKIALADIGTLAARAKQIISMAQEEKDEGTAGLFTDFLVKYQKTIWMMNAFLK